MAESSTTKVRAAEARARLIEAPIKTYLWDSPSRYPILFGGGYRSIYPYTMEDRLLHKAVEKSYKQLVLENEYIQVILLPELGGHLWRAYDKVSGKEIFYNNQVVKPGLIALRGAWCATGVEWNFPIGHSVSTTSPVDFSYWESADGSASAVVGDVDRTTRMRWTVKITVFPGQLAFRVDTVLSNPTTYPHRYMYWENAAMHATEGFQFIAPAKKAWTWGGKTDFPVVDGVDKSWYNAHPRAIDYFALGLGQDYFGYYDHQRRFGAVHVADYHLMPGKKFFTWGMAQHARSWQKNLTDDDGPYIELQCGLTPTQAAFDFFTPQTSIRWDEVWFSIGDLGYFVQANREAAIHLSDRLESRPYPESVEVGIVTNRPRKRAKATISADGKPLLEEAGVDFAAGVPRRWTVKFPAEARHLEVSLADADGTIIEYSTREWEDIRELQYENPRDLSNLERAGARKLVAAAISNLKWFNYRKAMELIDRAIAAKPDYADARYWRGNFLYNLFEYGEAEKELSGIRPRNANYIGARYLLAEIKRFRGEYDEAMAIARRVSRLQGGAVIGKSLAGRIALQKGEYPAAARYLKAAAETGKAAPFVMGLYAAALRRAGRVDEAREAAKKAAAVDPLDYIVLNELELLGEGGDKDRLMRGVEESYVELAAYYEDAGLFEEAAKVLEDYRTHVSKDGCGPLLLYHLGWCNERLERPSEAEAFYRAAAKANPDNFFPYRREDVSALRAALRRNEGDSTAHYLIGCFLGWRLHDAETLEHWTKALEGLGSYSVLLRNIGLYHSTVTKDYAKAAEFYQRAIKAAPTDEELYAEADDVYAKLGAMKERIASLESGLEALAGSQKVRKLLGLCYYYAARYDDALNTIMTSEFDHWEGDRMAHIIYVRSLIEKGKLLLEEKKYAEAIDCFGKATEYPANLKVGRPAFPRHAPQLYLSGIAYEGLGEIPKAQAVWKEGAEEVHEGWEGSVSEEGYYKGLCLARMGRRREARSIWRNLTKGVTWHWGSAEWRDEFVKGLGCQGLGEWDKAAEHFEKALAVDRTNRQVMYHLELSRRHEQAGA